MTKAPRKSQVFDSSGAAAELERLLSERAQRHSALPALRSNVTQELEVDEQARRWLRDNPGGLLGNGSWLARNGIASPRVWAPLFAAVVGAVTGLWAGKLGIVELGGGDLGLAAAVFCAVLATAAAQLPQLGRPLAQ